MTAPPADRPVVLSAPRVPVQASQSTRADAGSSQLEFVLALAVCAFTAAGHDSPAAVAEWAAGCSQQTLAVHGGRRDHWSRRIRPPSVRTFSRVFSRIDAEAFKAALYGYLAVVPASPADALPAVTVHEREQRRAAAARVVLPVVTADSRHVRHFQLANLIAAATTGAIAGNPPALELGSLLAKLMHRHSLGDVNGAGLALFPDINYKLLHHCFRETGWSNPGMMSGVTLPGGGGHTLPMMGSATPSQPPGLMAEARSARK